MNFLRVVIAALACMAPPGLPRAEESCSKPVAGAVREPDYSFGYGWWFEGYSVEHILVRCVINQSAERALFINWVGAGLQGFARPRSSMYVKEVHRDEQQESIKTAYGTEPTYAAWTSSPCGTLPQCAVRTPCRRLGAVLSDRRALRPSVHLRHRPLSSRAELPCRLCRFEAN